MDLTRLLMLGFIALLQLIQFSNSANSGFYFDDFENGQEKTVLIDKLSKKQQRIIKEEMLNILGLEKVPKMKKNKNKSAPKYMLDLYKKYALRAENEVSDSSSKYSESENSRQQPDLVISFVNHANKHAHLRHDRNRMYFFDFSEVPATEAVCQSDFRVYKRPSEADDIGKTLSIAVYQLVKDSFDSETHFELEGNRTVKSSFGGWLDFNITSAATEWTYFPVTNLGLFMEITDETGADVDPKDVGIIGRKGPEDLQPFLVAYFRASKKVASRSRRGTTESGDRARRQVQDVSYIEDPMMKYVAKRTRCEKRALYVSFLDLKWQEWIISPKGYAAFYCMGQCAFPLNSHMNATNHAIVQTLVHLKRASIPEPCCAPTKLSPVSVLYFDERNNVILKNYKNMVVVACGCH